MRCERELDFWFSWNIMEWGLGPGGMHIATPPWTRTVGGLFNGPPVKLPNYNFLDTAMNTFF